MQVVRFGKKEDSSVIDIGDVVEDDTKLYCSPIDGKLYFLIKVNGNEYIWDNLILRPSFYGSRDKYPCFSDALYHINNRNWKLLIFDNQCEVLEYAKKM